MSGNGLGVGLGDGGGEGDGSNNSEHWLTIWESTIANELEARTTEHDIENEKLATGQKLWLSFQQTATKTQSTYTCAQVDWVIYFPFIS